MLAAFPVCRLFGIRVRVHVVFVLLFGLLLLQTAWAQGLAVALHTATRFLVLFACVVLHELGHSLVAQAKGIRVHDIVLWPLGGMARLERIPRDPTTELEIAAAGPAVNFFLVLVLLPWMLARGEGGTLDPLAMLGGTPLEFAVAVNAGMGVFNLVPAFPLDGGRILRALLARRFRYEGATRLAVGIGRVLAAGVVLASIGTIALPIVLLLAAFVYWAGGHELRHLDPPSPPSSPREPSPGARRFLHLERGADGEEAKGADAFAGMLDDPEGGRR